MMCPQSKSNFPFKISVVHAALDVTFIFLHMKKTWLSNAIYVEFLLLKFTNRVKFDHKITKDIISDWLHNKLSCIGRIDLPKYYEIIIISWGSMLSDLIDNLCPRIDSPTSLLQKYEMPLIVIKQTSSPQNYVPTSFHFGYAYEHYPLMN